MMEALLQHFPRDISNIIDGMKNHSDHHDKLKDCFIPLRIKTLHRHLYHIDTKMYHRNQSEIDRVYRENFPDLQSSLELLAQCNCCQTHQECKPTTTHNLKETDYRICCKIMNSSKQTRKLTCICPCRYYARKLTRAHLYTMFEHEEDNRYILHKVFLRTHEELKHELSLLSELKKQRKNVLHQMNTVFKDEDYLSNYRKYNLEYYQIMSKLEEQEIHVHTCEEQDTEITHMLENHILDFPGIVNSYDEMFRDMFMFPESNIMYDTDISYDSEDDAMTNV